MDVVKLVYLDLSPEGAGLLQEKCKELLLHANGKPHQYWVSPLSYRKLVELKLAHRVLKSEPVAEPSRCWKLVN